jgi:hypothetical protein
MPQALTAMSFKMAIPVILMTFGLANTIFIGLAIMLFATVGHGTPVWQIILLAAIFGFCSSLQYTRDGHVAGGKDPSPNGGFEQRALRPSTGQRRGSA